MKVVSPFCVLLRCLLALSATVLLVVRGLPREQVLVDSKGFANIAFHARDGEVFLVRFNDFYYSWTTGGFDNITTDAIHRQLEPGQGNAPIALSDPRVFELQDQQRTFVSFLSQDNRIALFEKINDTKRWRFAQSHEVLAVGNITGFGDAKGVVHLLYREQFKSLQELKFDPDTYSWLPASKMSIPGRLSTDVHVCKLGSEHVLVLQASGRLFYGDAWCEGIEGRVGRLCANSNQRIASGLSVLFRRS